MENRRERFFRPFNAPVGDILVVERGKQEFEEEENTDEEEYVDIEEEVKEAPKKAAFEEQEREWKRDK